MKKLIFLFMSLMVLASCTQAAKQQSKTTEKAVDITSESVFNIATTWENADGQEIQLADLKGNVLVMAMVYTSCKASCPRLAFDMKKLEEKVKATGAKDVKYVFISIDPETDTPEKMQAFFKNYKMQGDQWVFLRSSEANTRELANILAVRYQELSPMEVSHSNIISVFSKGGVLAFQKEGLDPKLDQTVKAIEKQL